MGTLCDCITPESPVHYLGTASVHSAFCMWHLYSSFIAGKAGSSEGNVNYGVIKSVEWAGILNHQRDNRLWCAHIHLGAGYIMLHLYGKIHILSGKKAASCLIKHVAQSPVLQMMFKVNCILQVVMCKWQVLGDSCACVFLEKAPIWSIVQTIPLDNSQLSA